MDFRHRHVPRLLVDADRPQSLAQYEFGQTGGSAHLDPDDKLVVPPNTVLSPIVPFDRGQ
jgi:hypothetical protein